MTPEKREAARVYAKAYYQANRERLIREAKERYRANRERVAARARLRKAMHRERNECLRLQRVYGITLDEYRRMADAQGSRCAICSIHASDAPKGKLFVDHAHRTGKVRQLLCGRCNMAIGLIKESADTLRRAAEYLERHTTVN